MDHLQIDPRLRDPDPVEDKSITVNGQLQSHNAQANETNNTTLSNHHSHQHQHLAIPSQPEVVESPATATSSSVVARPSPISHPAPSYGTPLAPHTPVTHQLQQSHSDTPHDAPPNTTPHDPNDPKRPRACEACRGLKVRCEPDPANPDGPCKRCAKANRQCLVTQPTRKRQKKTDSRVAELEKKIDALTASLQASRGGPPHHAHSPADPQNGYANLQQYANAQRDWSTPAQPQYAAPEPEKQQSYIPPMVMAGQKRKFAETRDSSADVSKHSPAPAQPSRNQEYATDMIDRGVMTMDQANDFFTRYTELMVPHLPAVVFPRGTTAADIRKTKPILFLALMAVSSSEYPNIQRQLVKELTRLFADKIVVDGEKSIELVQALQISVVWYFPPEHFEELKFYQFVHVGAVMAIDLGLGRRRNSSKTRLVPYTWRDHPFRKHPLPDPTSIECRRAWLACYFMASNVAMALHRPNLIRWNSFMTECIDILESSPEAAPTDKFLCHLVWTHRLAEEVGIQFSMDDPSSFVNVAEPKVQYALRAFERELTKYSDGIPQAEKGPALILGFHVLNLYMHEIALYVEKSDDFRTTFSAGVLTEPVPGLNESLTPAHINALSSCLTAIDGIFETFLSMDVSSIRCLPVFNFVRVAYAVVVLIKMYFSASTPNSELGKVINKDHMKVDEYLDRMLDKFREVAAGDRSRPAGKFLIVLVMLRSWFQKQGKVPFPSGPDQMTPPQTSQGPNNTSGSPSISAPSKNESAKTAASSTPNSNQQNEYNPANTPLQLLSEIATGNDARGGPSNPNTNQQNVSANPATSGTTAYQQQLQPWLQTSSTHTPVTYDATTGDFQSGGVLPYLNSSFNSDLDYSQLGDGFEQAMGLTLTGFPAASGINWMDDPVFGSMFGDIPGNGPF